MLTEEVARKLDIDARFLEKESLRLYLEIRKRQAEADLFRLAQRYGVQTVQEFDESIRQGKLHEREAFEDFSPLTTWKLSERGCAQPWTPFCDSPSADPPDCRGRVLPSPQCESAAWFETPPLHQ